MKLIALFLSLLCLGEAQVSKEEFGRLMSAMCQKESAGGRVQIGDLNFADHAYGPLQIRQPCLDDAIWQAKHSDDPYCRSLLVELARTDKDMSKASSYMSEWNASVLVLRAYMLRYATKRRLGREVRAEDIARIWNGGPNGWKSKHTLGYWQDVKKFMFEPAPAKRHNSKTMLSPPAPSVPLTT